MSCGKLILRVAQYLPFLWVEGTCERFWSGFPLGFSVASFFFHRYELKGCALFYGGFVNSYTGGVSFLLECLQGLVSFLFIAFVVGLCLGVCGCAWVCTRGACACVCPAGCTAVYSCINWSWSLVQSLES